MASRIRLFGMLACLAAMAASSGITMLFPNRTRGVATPGVAQLRAYGGRSLQQRQGTGTDKFDGTLADIVRHAPSADSGPALAGLHSMSPAARFKVAGDGMTPLVAIDAVTRGDPQALLNVLQELGLERAAVYANDVGGWLPVSQLQAAAARAEVHGLRAAMSRTRSGAVTSQGDFVQHSAALRAADSLTGSGVTVGVLSDSYDCYAVYAAAGSGVPASGYAGYAYNGFLATAATDIATGDLPASVDVLEEAECLMYGAPLFPPLGDEGREMLQIVHDVAPGAALAFYTADDSEADFAAGIGKLASAGAKVIADDVGYFDEPFFQDGIVAQAIDAAEAKGVAYFSAAGNDGNASYENTAPTFPSLATSGANSGERLMNFDPSGITVNTALPVTIDALQPGEFVAVVVEWDQPYVTGAAASGGASSRIDVCVTGATAEYTIQDYDGNTVTCTGANAAGVDPVQVLIIANPANATGNTPKETLSLMVGLADGTAPPGRVKVVVESDGQTDAPITEFATDSPTLQGHPGAAGAAAVGAAFYFQTPACGSSAAVLETYSAEGGEPILFDVNGVRLATPVVRQKPDFVGPDGGNDTFLGFTLASAGYTAADGELSTTVTPCQNEPAYPNFFGTSAATPHVAGIAALMLQANAASTPSAIDSALRDSALAMGGTAGYNVNSGFGFVQADAAIALLPPGVPTVTLAAAAVTAGSSTTITWSSVNATGCTASGSWSSALAAAGTQTVTPTTAGTADYALVCSNAAGSSTAATADLNVTAAAQGGGGGGMMNWLWLITLAAISGLSGGRAAAATRICMNRQE
jgi:hypothetical protein